MDSFIFPLSLDSSSLLSLSSLYIYGIAVYSIVQPPRDILFIKVRLRYITYAVFILTARIVLL
jgi:hypothetical protein